MKKYTYNLGVLDEWSPGLAYVLGLALTDGTVHKNMVRVTFYSSDKQMLEIVKRFFASTREVELHSIPGKYSFEKNGTSYTGKKQMYSFHIDSMQAAQRFNQLGVIPNKSYDGLYPIVPKNLWWHYFRGILDSDGNIFFSRKTGLRVAIAGNKQCILGLQSDLSNWFSIRSRTAYLEDDKCKYLYLHGAHAEKALTCMYQDSNDFRLERKHAQWLEHYRRTLLTEP